MTEDLLKLIFYFETGAKTELDIIQWAMNQVIKGNQSDAILKLASLSGNEERHVKSLFKTALEEMGYQYPQKEVFGTYRIKLIIESMIAGRVLPEKGCLVLGRISAELGRPEELQEFERLSQQLSNRNNTGLTEDEFRQKILDAAHTLKERQVKLKPFEGN